MNEEPRVAEDHPYDDIQCNVLRDTAGPNVAESPLATFLSSTALPVTEVEDGERYTAAALARSSSRDLYGGRVSVDLAGVTAMHDATRGMRHVPVAISVGEMPLTLVGTFDVDEGSRALAHLLRNIAGRLEEA